MSDVLAGVVRKLEKGRYYHDPAGWLDAHIDWKVGECPAPYQREAISALTEHKRVAVRSLHGAGKTTTAAWVCIWFSYTRENAGVDWKILTTASAWRHLNLYLWPEIHKWLKRVKWDDLGTQRPEPRTQLLDMRLKLEHGAASAVASDEPVNIEGAHADSILYVFDESKAIPNETWDAAEGALSGDSEGGMFANQPEAYALAISTPGEPSGRFYDIHSRKPGLEDWYPIHVTLEDAIEAKRVSRKWAEQRKLQFGADSAVYRNRVLGEFASSDDDVVIPLSWVEAAIQRWHEWNDAGTNPVEGSAVLSVDVARSGSDDTAISFRRGHVITGLKRVQKRDTMGVTARVQGASAQAEQMFGTLPEIIVDTIGVGAGVFDRLRELGYKVHPFTGSAKAHIRDVTGTYGFTNTRSAAYWSVREMLDPANGLEIALPNDDRLIGELTSPKWSLTTGAPPRIKVEPKDDVTKRLGRSPDAADCIVMSLYRERIRRPSEAVSGASTFARSSIVDDETTMTRPIRGRVIARSPFPDDRMLAR